MPLGLSFRVYGGKISLIYPFYHADGKSQENKLTGSMPEIDRRTIAI
jgi:hypothetical protein